MKRPQILSLSLTEKANQLLVEKGYDVYKGSLGKLIDTKNKRYEGRYCLANFDFPPNFHEFDIVIVDLSNEEKISYSEKENIRLENKSNSNLYMFCEHPQTIFDPRGLAIKKMSGEIIELIKKESMLIVFQEEVLDHEYHMVEENGDRPISKNKFSVSNYEFMPTFPFVKNKHGIITKVVPEGTEFAKLLNKYNSDFSYENIYNHPTMWVGNERVFKPKFYPLLRNTNDEIVSFVNFKEKSSLYLFPKMSDYSNFLIEFIQNIGPEYQPALFPNSTLKKWTNDNEYALPNHLKLLEEKENILEEFKKRDEAKELEIAKNIIEYDFLHNILTESGDNLVHAVIKFLEWLGFVNVVDMDTQVITIKEEDIQIETSTGLLVIEVKGIGGTSKDSECSQISKIKYRRAKQRGVFDVFGLYIVNHQRYLPPLKRENPPFNSEQIAHAIDDERGLLTTWDLFNLFYDVEKEIINKEEARERFYDYGLISFKPKNLKLISKIEEVFLKGLVFILKLDKITLKVGDILFIEKNGKFEKLTIIELKLNDKSVDEVYEGEVGIKGDIFVNKMSNVYIKF